jgi:Tfp pilus assembly protein PilN
MRPVNLIPPEERRDKAAVRTGPVAYLLVGALVLVLGAVTMLVLANNDISDHKAEIADLQQQQSQARAQAAQYASFNQFAQVEQSRKATIKSLADSRFDWERVMNELARVIPGDVWLTNLSGAVTPAQLSASSSGTGAAIDTSSITGPSLSLEGCAASQDAVARLLSSLRDVDGVTRVALASSDLPDQSSSSGVSDSGGAAGSSDCTIRNFLAKFQIVAAFDGVPTPPVAGAVPSTAAAAPGTTTTPPTTTTPTTTPPSTTDSSSSSSTPASTTPATDSGN